MSKRIISGPCRFVDAVDLAAALTGLHEEARFLDDHAVVYVVSNEPFLNGTASLEAETLSDDSVVYNIIIRPTT